MHVIKFKIMLLTFSKQSRSAELHIYVGFNNIYYVMFIENTVLGDNSDN